VKVAADLASGKLKVDREKQKGFIRKATDQILSVGVVRDFVFKKALETVMKKTGGLYPSPLKILDVSLTVDLCIGSKGCDIVCCPCFLTYLL